jgi:hypothetical protein
MHFGVQDAVCALAHMELGASDDSKDDKRQREAIYFLEQLHEHLKAITTPVRRVCLPYVFALRYYLSVTLTDQ